MKIQVDWYKVSTGKWYTGGVVDVGEARLHRIEEFKRAIVNNQKQLLDNWTTHDEYIVVTSSINDDVFCNALFYPSSFSGMKRRV